MRFFAIDLAKRRPHAILVIGMMCLVLGILSQNLPTGLGPSLHHFVTGFLFGLSIALNCGALLAMTRSRHGRNA
jgi:hypothetical protein